ncbi:MAG TPA: hypothetical protein VFX28_15065 [Methylomirabilota bacterium]|nr:hypothetical protein [Methylomirabilota bacterium]
MHRQVRAAVLALGLALAAACGTGRQVVDERTTQGPTAEEFWLTRVTVQNGREPTFEERRYWEDQVEARIREYLRRHPEAANSLDVSRFRFLRQVTVGMDKEQVRILLGAPARTSGDAAEMANVARRFWPDIRGQADEVWVYPLGWAFYFSGPRLVEITRYVPPS